jgi:hypothetical protein
VPSSALTNNINAYRVLLGFLTPICNDKATIRNIMIQLDRILKNSSKVLQSLSPSSPVVPTTATGNKPTAAGAPSAPTHAGYPTIINYNNTNHTGGHGGGYMSTQAPKASSSASSVASWFWYPLLLVTIGFSIWIMWSYYRKRRELRMLDERSAQADRVLGDMQMLPSDDPDNELI